MDESSKIDVLSIRQTAQAARGKQAVDSVKALSKKSKDSPEEIEKAASGFESLLLKQMLDAMWKTVDTTGLMGENKHEAGMYRDMFNQALAEEISDGKGIGVKDYLRKELLRVGRASKP